MQTEFRAIIQSEYGAPETILKIAKRGDERDESVHKILGEGNFVLLVAEATFGGVPTGIYDLFRIEKGRIAEHWDTLEAIPPRDQWKNSNGKF